MLTPSAFAISCNATTDGLRLPPRSRPPSHCPAHLFGQLLRQRLLGYEQFTPQKSVIFDDAQCFSAGAGPALQSPKVERYRGSGSRHPEGGLRGW